MLYLLHFDRPFGHAGHYLGWTTETGLASRITEHRAGKGARLCAVVVAAGIGMTLARTWPGGTRKQERQLKNRGGHARLCPICKGLPVPHAETID